jgi:hypothetical protein
MDAAKRRRHWTRLAGHVGMRVASIGLQAVMTLAIGWICAPADFGELVIIMTYAVAGSTLCAGGALQGALRVAHLVAPGSAWEGPVLRLLTASALRRAAVGAALVSLALWFNPGVSPTGALAGMALTLAMTLAACASGFTIARGQAPTNQAFELWLRLPVQATGIALLYATGHMSGPGLAASAAVAAAAHGAGLLLRLPLKANTGRVVPAAMGILLGKFITTASSNAVLFTLLSSLEVLLGSHFVMPEDIAPLGIAGRIAGALAMLHGAVFDFHAASIARSLRGLTQGEVRRLTRTVSIESTLLTLATMLASAAAVALMPDTMPATYRSAVAPLWVLLGARLVIGALGPCPALITLRGMHARLAVVTSVGIATEAALILLLAQKYGATGLAIAGGIGMCVYAAMARASAGSLLGPRRTGNAMH